MPKFGRRGLLAIVALGWAGQSAGLWRALGGPARWAAPLGLLLCWAGALAAVPGARAHAVPRGQQPAIWATVRLTRPQPTPGVGVGPHWRSRFGE